MGLTDINRLFHTKWNCKYHTAGKNTSRIAEYIKNQLEEDQR